VDGLASLAKRRSPSNDQLDCKAGQPTYGCPHEALGDATPSSRYTPSPRVMPSRLAPIEYPGHDAVRRVSTHGGIRWDARWVNVSQTLGREPIGLVEIDDGEWDVYFGRLRLGPFHERTYVIEDAHGHHRRRNHLRVSPLSLD
jgi:hypothetical protein